MRFTEPIRCSFFFPRNSWLLNVRRSDDAVEPDDTCYASRILMSLSCWWMTAGMKRTLTRRESSTFSCSQLSTGHCVRERNRSISAERTSWLISIWPEKCWPNVLRSYCRRFLLRCVTYTVLYPTIPRLAVIILHGTYCDAWKIRIITGSGIIVLDQGQQPKNHTQTQRPWQHRTAPASTEQ